MRLGCFTKNRLIQVNLSGENAKLVKHSEKELAYKEPKGFQADFSGNKAIEDMTHSNEGNVVLGFTSSNFLMLDSDDQIEYYVLEFANEYGKFHKLGSHIVLRTSKSTKTDLFGNRLGNYAIIFGKPIMWSEVQWHIKEVLRLGAINRAFAKLRDFGTITIRVNFKNKKIPPPEVIRFCNNGEMTGIVAYIKHKNTCEGLGESWLQKSN